MPAFGKGILKPEEINDVATYVLQMRYGQPQHPSAAWTAGQAIFAGNCAACHGAAGEGNRTLGAPRLNDAIWLYGGDKASVVETITNSRAGVMPTYVHSLGGGE
jgi:cytochrome c oxidase cbb3-type subunit 3